MLKTRQSIGSAANPKKGKSKASSNSVIGNSMVDGVEAINQINSIKRKNQTKTTKSIILVKSKNHDFPLNFRNRKTRTDFFTPKARLVFTQLRQTFIKAPILYYFDLECHIRIKTDASGYAIGGVSSQLAFGTKPD